MVDVNEQHPLLDRINDQVHNLVRDASKQMGPLSFWDQVCAFVAAVNWSERWLLALGVFHLAYAVTVFASRHWWQYQAALVVISLALVRLAEPLNTLAGSHWEEFATQNYFDKDGVFMSVMWSAPFVLTSMFSLSYNLYATSRMLVQVKRRELRKVKKSSSSSGGSSGGSGSASGDGGDGGDASITLRRSKRNKKSK